LKALLSLCNLVCCPDTTIGPKIIVEYGKIRADLRVNKILLLLLPSLSYY